MFQSDALLYCPHPQDRDDIGNQDMRCARLRMEFHLAGLDLRQVENVVDDSQEMPPALPDGLQVVAALRFAQVVGLSA